MLPPLPADEPDLFAAPLFEPVVADFPPVLAPDEDPLADDVERPEDEEAELFAPPAFAAPPRDELVPPLFFAPAFELLAPPDFDAPPRDAPPLFALLLPLFEAVPLFDLAPVDFARPLFAAPPDAGREPAPFEDDPLVLLPELRDELADDVFDAEDFPPEDFEELEPDPLDFAPLDLDPPERDADDFAVEDFPLDDPDLFPLPDVPLVGKLSAAAPTAPTAAPVAAPPKISVATSITLSMMLAAVLLDFFDVPDDERVPLFDVLFFSAISFLPKIEKLEQFVLDKIITNARGCNKNFACGDIYLSSSAPHISVPAFQNG